MIGTVLAALTLAGVLGVCVWGYVQQRREEAEWESIAQRERAVDALRGPRAAP